MSVSRRALFRLAFDEESQAESSPRQEPPPPAIGRIAWQDARHARPALLDGPQVAKVLTFSCLNAGADFCATCVERCPEPGAIAVQGRVVVVDPLRCTGCGECVAVCPAPGGAIVMARAS